MENTAPPPYLYKILSFVNWQATQNQRAVRCPAEDDAFIHFSMEEQLDRILAKYWSDQSCYVILKIAPQKMEGRLVLETNPGGTAKYYHLYDGLIPFEAIAEARIVFREQLEPVARSLPIVKIGEPVLRQRACPLTRDEILSEEIQTLIQEMKETMRAAPGVGLAAPQIGRNIQLAVIEDIEHGHLTADQLKERDRSLVPFHVIINPQLFIETEEKVEFFEGCLSIPEFLGVVPRAKSVRVECLDEQGNQQVIRASGWYARILQHEIDHLCGILYLDRCKVRTLMTQENYLKLWKSKKIPDIETALQSTGQSIGSYP